MSAAGSGEVGRGECEEERRETAHARPCLGTLPRTAADHLGSGRHLASKSLGGGSEDPGVTGPMGSGEQPRLFCTSCPPGPAAPVLLEPVADEFPRNKGADLSGLPLCRGNASARASAVGSEPFQHRFLGPHSHPGSHWGISFVPVQEGKPRHREAGCRAQGPRAGPELVPFRPSVALPLASASPACPRDLQAWFPVPRSARREEEPHRYYRPVPCAPLALGFLYEGTVTRKSLHLTPIPHLSRWGRSPSGTVVERQHLLRTPSLPGAVLPASRALSHSVLRALILRRRTGDLSCSRHSQD